MKKLLLLIIAFAIFSCQSERSKTEKTQDKIVEQFKSTLNDPESFELVNFKLVDSVLYIDNIEYRKESYSENIKREKDYKEKGYSIFDSTSLNKNEQYLKRINAVQQDLGDKVNDVASYTYIIEARANNALGAKVKNNYFIQTDPEYKIINIASNRGELYSTPNGFPGYEDKVLKN